MPATNVKSNWNAGNLEFLDGSGNVICYYDGTNRQLVLPTGSTLEINTGGDITINGDSLVAEVAALTGLDSGEIQVLNAVTPGAAAASKVAVLDANKTWRLGGFNTGAALTLAVPFVAGLNFYTDGQLDVFSVFGGSAVNLTNAYSAKCGRFRHVVNCTTAAHETYGLVGQVVVKDTTLTHLHAGLMGTFEGHTSGVVCNSAYSVGHAGVIARIGGHAAITATTPLAGFLAFNNQSGAIGGGSTAGFATSMYSGTYPWTYGVYIPDDSTTTGIYVGDVTTAIDARGLVTVAKTVTSATPATARLIRSELTLTPATTMAVGSNGSMVGVRGAVTLTTGKDISDGYLYGVQGKLVLDGATVAVGSDHIAAVYGQLSMSGTTLTSGHISAIHADIQATPSSSLVNGVYVESATGNVINAFFAGFGKTDYVFDLASNTHVQMSTTGTAGATATKGWLKVRVEGAVRYIPLTDAVT